MKILVKKTLAVLVAFAVIISMLPGLPLETYATDHSWTGDGTEASPYLVQNASDILAMQEAGDTYAGKYFKVTANIEVPADSGFIGIGNSSKAFKGNFDGNNKEITLAISAQSESNVGLFGYAGTGAVIQNVTVKGSVAGAYSVGGIVGYNYGGTVKSCINEAEIKTDAPTYNESGAGGIAGSMAGGTIENCSNKGTIVAGYTSDTGSSKINFGGIVGYVNSDSTISDCHNSGNMTAIPSTAGVAGIAGKISRANTVIEDCSNSGDIEVKGTGSNSSGGAAGIAGYISGEGSSVERCSNSGQITGRDYSSAYTGGIVGRTNSQCIISQSYNKGTVTAPNGYVGGIAGYLAASVTAESCYNAGEVKNTKTSGSTSSYSPSVAAGIAAQLGGNTASVKNCYSYGNISNNSTGTYAYAAGIIGKAYSTTINSGYIDGNTYLQGSASKGIGNLDSDAEGYSDSDDTQKILDVIGNDYQKDLDTNINNGYPILRWQNENALYKLVFDVTDAEMKNKLDNVSIAVKDSNDEAVTAGTDGSYEVAPGTYSYTVSRAGYTTLSEDVVIKKASKTLDIKLTSIKHKFKITVTPVEATLTVTNDEAPKLETPEKTETDGKAVYTYMLADKAAYGDYSYSAASYGYNKTSGTLSATGENDEVVITMEAATKNKFEITVSPKNAKVILTNTEYGVTVAADNETDGVWTYNLIPGEYSYKVKASGYTTEAGTVTMNSADDKKTVSLEEKLTWDGTSTDTDWYDGDEDIFNISEPEELAGLAKLVNEGVTFEGKTINLTKDIDLGGNSEGDKNHWTSIGNNKQIFKGTFNGKGHKIKNLYINMTGTAGAANGHRGLFGQTANAVISDFTLEGVDITTSTKTGYQNVGAIVGYGKATDIKNIVTSGDIRNNDSASYNGGIAGKFSGSIIDCINNVNITAGYQVGGIIGTTYDNNGTQILRCVNNGKITANNTGTTKSYASGGIVGCLYKADDVVRYCINKGVVTGSNQSLGGIVGATNTGSYKNQKIIECYNMGAVTATKDTSYVGGIVGYVVTTNNPYINNCYSAGELTGSNNIGGIIGSQSSNSINSELIYNNYYKSNDSYKGSRYGTGNTTTVLENEAFEAFETVPVVDELGNAYGADVKDGEEYRYNNGYPILRWQNPDSVYDIKFVPEYDVEYNLDDNSPVKLHIKDKDDKEMQVTGTVAKLPNGEYSYTVEKKGYETVTGNITVDRESFEQQVELKAIKYNYAVTIEEGADFDLVMETEDGDVAITRPEYKDGKYTYQLYNGAYKYTANKLGKDSSSGNVTISFADANQEVELKAKAMASVTFAVTAKEGTFTGNDPVVYIYNDDADDYYKNTLMGEYDSTSDIAKGIMFPAGSYTYKIKADGFSTETGEFIVEKDKPVTITKELEVKTGWGGSEDVDTDWYTDYPDEAEYILVNEAQLAGLAKLVNGGMDFKGKTVKLAKDMNLSENAWTPIGGFGMNAKAAFSGIFDGDGHTITFKNGEIKNSQTTFGLFGYLLNATVKNLVLQGNAKVSYTEETASFTMAYVGAIVGYTYGGQITNCSNQMTFDVAIINEAGTASVNLGGIAGWSVGTSYDRSNNIAKVSGSVTGKGTTTCYAGGIAGFNNSGSSALKSITSNCYNTGNINTKALSNTGGKATGYAGGLFGNLNAAYLTMSNCYSAAEVAAEASTDQKEGALVGNKSGTGSFANNYYINNGLNETTANSAKKTEAEMKDSGFVNTLGDAYRVNANGGYPILDWEASVDHIEITANPDKLIYDDLSDFDDAGMEITAYMDKSDTDGKVVTSGWTVKDGKSLKAGQKTVTIEYKGAETTVDITVNQIVHLINNDELAFDITAPETGKTPQDTLESGSDKFSAVISWTKGGKPFTDNFEDGTYYRAEIALTSKYKAGDVYWAFDKNSMPAVDSAYEIKNIKFEKAEDENNANNVMKFTVTFKATSSVSGLTDKVSHLYYEGDNSTLVKFGDYLDNTLAIEGGVTKTYTVRELEQLALDKAVGVEGKFGEYELAGIKLYDLLLESGLSQNTADETKVYIYGKNKKAVETTIGKLRSEAGKKPAVIAYGDVANGMPLGSAYGPLRVVQQDISGIWCSNVSKIVIGDVKEADRYNVTFSVEHSDGTDANADVTVKDSYSNTVTPGADNVYSLRSGETYSYTVSESGYGIETGEITVKEDTEIKVSLRPSWDGKTLTEPAKDEEGYYLIGTADELMWWNANYKETDKVKLTADITLNNGKDNINKWEVLGTNSGYGSSKTLAFQGHFDGQGHVIRGFYINRENELEFEIAWDGSVMEFSDRISEIGMFGYTGGEAVIENLGIEGVIEILDRPDSMYADWMQVGGIVGFAQGYTQIKNCYTNIGIKCVASTEPGTVGGCPLAGWGDKCDTYIGGIAGSISSEAAISDCYSKGTLIGAEARQITIGGIAGGIRSAKTSITNCYSTASIQPLPLENTTWDSYVGGIVGQGAWSGNAGTIKGSVALNSNIKGNNTERITAARVAGNSQEDKLDGNLGLSSMMLNGVKTDNSEQLNGKLIKLEEAMDASTYSTWDAENTWNLGGYPQLKWQTVPAGEDITVRYEGQTYDDDDEWDGYFGSAAAPSYFNVNFKVDGHESILAKKFTREQMTQMAEADNEGTLYYSAVGFGYAGRAVKEYVYLDTILKNAGVTFGTGDKLAYGSYYEYPYEYLMADRYYYPEWTSGSDADAVKIKPVIALKSFGASSGVTKELWNYYAMQADYLYAYMLTFGQTTPDEDTYGKFTYQQVEGTVVYDDEAQANNTVKTWLESVISQAEEDYNSTYGSENGKDVPGGYKYVSAEDKEKYLEKIDETKAALADENATNGSLMDAGEALEKTTKAFAKKKKDGLGKDRTKLDSAIKMAEKVLEETVVSEDGSELHEDTQWITADKKAELEAALKDAKDVYEDVDAAQSEIDDAAFALASILGEFTTEEGRIEQAARDAAVEFLNDYGNYIDRSKYRDKELAEIDRLIEEGLKQINEAVTVNTVKFVLDDTIDALKAVKTALDAEKADAKAELDNYFSSIVDSYDASQRVVLREALIESQEKIDRANSTDEVASLISAGKAAMDKIEKKSQQGGGIIVPQQPGQTSSEAAKALETAKSNAIETLESWYKDNGQYYDEQKKELSEAVLAGVKAIKEAKDITEVSKALEEVVGKIKTIKTKEQIDAEKAVSEELIKQKKATAVLQVKALKVITKTAKTAKGNIKITAKADLTELKDAGFTVKYKFYRSSKKTSGYKLMKTKSANSYVNTSAKKGKRYYYKTRVSVYYNGELVTQTTLKQSTRGSRKR